MDTEARRTRKGINWQAAAIVSTVLLAFIGYAVTYANNVRIEQRKSQIEYLNEQLENLYGPLYSLTNAGRVAWEAFRGRYRPGGAFFSTENPPDERELAAWVLWMREIFMPNNLKMERVIIENAHLIDGPSMPRPFTDFLVHVEGYKVVMKKWESGDYSEFASFNNYPQELNIYVNQTFNDLKARQAELLGRD